MRIFVHYIMCSIKYFIDNLDRFSFANLVIRYLTYCSGGIIIGQMVERETVHRSVLDIKDLLIIRGTSAREATSTGHSTVISETESWPS